VGREVYDWAHDSSVDLPEKIEDLDRELGTFYTGRIDEDFSEVSKRTDFYNNNLDPAVDKFRGAVFDAVSSIDEGSHENAYGFYEEAVEASREIEEELEQAPEEAPWEIRGTFLSKREQALQNILASLDLDSIHSDVQEGATYNPEAV
jgi:hypothetical protein